MGLFAALGGLSLTASTGIGTPVPVPTRCFSVAAIVLGGVSLAGGVGGLFGPIVAVIILSLIRTDMTFLNVNTNLAVVAQGVILIAVVMFGSAHPDAAATDVSGVPFRGRHEPLADARRLAPLFRDRPIVPLPGLLAVLVGLTELARPGIVSPDWIEGVLRPSIPLAILAGCQTIAMLTGGIDLSVGAVASMSGFLVSTLVNGPGVEAGIAAALVAAALAGLVTGLGVGIFRVHPLIMTLAMSLVVLGLANVWQILMVQTGRRSSRGPPDGRLESSIGLIPNSLFVFVPVAHPDPRRACAARATDACCSPSGTIPSRRGSRAPGRGRC